MTTQKKASKKAESAAKTQSASAFAGPFADFFNTQMFDAKMFDTDAYTKAFDAVPGYQDAVDFSKGNVDAAMQAGEIFAKGVQDLSTLWMETAKASFEDGNAAAKAIMECRSLPDVVEVQTGLAKETYEKTLDNGRKLSDASLKVMEEASEPLAQRVSVAVEKFAKPIAA